MMDLLVGYYVTLDAIQDVKLDILLREVSGKVKAEDIGDVLSKYIFRRTEFFGGKEQGDALLAAYAKRNKHHLAASVDTTIGDLLYNDITEVSNYAKGVGMNYTNVVYLNYYPYDLNKEEQDVLAEGFLNSRTFDNTELKLVNLEPSKVSPKWLKIRKVEHAWMVDGIEWLNLHAELETLGNGAPKCVLHVPAILPKYIEDVDREFTRVDPESKLDMWNMYSYLALPVIRLDFIPAMDFSSKSLSAMFLGQESRVDQVAKDP